METGRYTLHPNWDFSKMFLFPKILSLKSFGNSYTKFAILDITYHFTCGKSDLYQNNVKFRNIITMFVWKFSFCSLHF